MKRLDVLGEMEDFLFINKPAGLLSIPDRYDPTILNVLRWIKDLNSNYLLAHRLDKETSGIMIIAKNAEAHKHIQLAFENRRVKKTYYALVRGSPSEDNGVIEAPLLISPSSKKVIIDKKGKPASTSWTVKEKFINHSLLEVRPRSGRMHQIRVHLAHIGLPIIADPVYGDGKPLNLSGIKRNYKSKFGKAERPLISRTALHAFAIAFEDLHGDFIELSCPLPKDFRATINQFRKNK